MGKLVLAGAGPGDPELITLKAARSLQQADVILTDRLVSDDILKQWAGKDAEIVYVGKQCRRGNSTPQETINQLIIEHTAAGKLVVRLKGGDSSVFSNILDELETAYQYNIPYEIIPGVTAALGAAAYTGIPLTARGFSTAVRFLTFYKSDILSESYWQELANTTDTLVFYMSSETLDGIVNKLTQYHISSDCHIAVVEQATTPMQNVYSSNIYNFRQKITETQFVSPSLVIVGKVVALGEQFGWIKNSASKELYFKPVAALKNSIDTHSNKKQHASRA